MSEYLSKKAVLEWLKKRLDETQFVREAHALAEVVAKIECGRFDADNSEIRRLRAALVKVVNRLEWWVKKFGCADVPGILFSRVSANEAIREAREALSTTTEPTNAAKVERFECPCCGCEISIKPKTELLKGEETA